MARNFNGSSQHGEAALSLAATPLTLAAWYRPSNTSGIRHILALGNSGDDTQNAIRGNNATLQAASFAGGSSASADIAAALTVGTLVHVAGIFRGATDRSIYVNGGGRVNNTTSRTVSSFSRARIASRARTTVAEYGAGDIAEAAIWNIDLSDAEIAALGRGLSPLVIRPQFLVEYWPLLGRTSPEPGLIGSLPVTLTNSPTQASHPPMRAPARWVYPLRTNAAAMAISPSVGALTMTGAVPIVRSIDNPRAIVPAAEIDLASTPPLIRKSAASTAGPTPSHWQTDSALGGSWITTPMASPSWTTHSNPPAGWSNDP